MSQMGVLANSSGNSPYRRGRSLPGHHSTDILDNVIYASQHFYKSVFVGRSAEVKGERWRIAIQPSSAGLSRPLRVISPQYRLLPPLIQALSTCSQLGVRLQLLLLVVVVIVCVQLPGPGRVAKLLHTNIKLKIDRIWLIIESLGISGRS